MANWTNGADVAVIDVPGFVAELKEHAGDHKFHIHDERHFIETYSMRQSWEVDLHPERACGGPLDLHLSLEIEPRTLLQFEDQLLDQGDLDDPPTTYYFPIVFTWVLPPLHDPPDLLVLATDLAGIGGSNLPLKVSCVDSTMEVTDAAERTLSITARVEIGVHDIYVHQDNLCDIFDRCYSVSEFLLDHAPVWLNDL